ncbi:prion-like-(Q/N-rich) domain-bearing protein 25 [Microplitis mediator]|uniref:prion-like-(Q/N-rich) domain-bearing protein 25 n=1 Tax=Microplitis mediator TaxID=375433 RepID=UPI0025522058|nr:prion-like-(Q/N-rich) domain-bearing protein 25 [Microplitis mediator]
MSMQKYHTAVSIDKCVETLLGTSCKNDQDCSDILHAKCSKDEICICRSNNIMVNKTSCQPLLGTFCWKDEKCAADHSSCVDNECQCNEGYMKQSNVQCLPNLIGSLCEIDSHCKPIRFSYCSLMKTCSCSSNTLSNDDQTSCLPLLNLYCETDDECKVDHSVCIDNWCKCKPLDMTISNTQCKEPYLGMACERTSDCETYMNHSTCSQSNHCRCVDFHYSINNRTCAPAFNATCDNEPCTPENSVCHDYECQCRPNYVVRGYKCVLKAFLGSPCQKDTDCQIIEFATCSDDYICVCQTNYSESDSSTCIPLIGGSCTVNNDCVTQNSYCFLKKCQCLDNFFAHSNDECTPKCAPPLGQFCTTSKPCEIENSICINNKCQCIPNLMKHLNAECVPRQSFQYCEDNSDCVGTGQTCSSDNKCVCKENHIPLALLGASCRNDHDCSDILHAKCSEDEICVCRSNNIMVNQTCCQPLLGTFCWKDEKCAADHSSCVDNECQCNENYIKQSNAQCLPNLIGSPCEIDSDCKTIRFSYCSSMKTCSCSLNTLSNDDQTSCLPLLNLYCETDDECKVDYSVCIDNWCKCKPLDITISNTQCKEQAFLESPCQKDTDCHIIEFATCSDDYMCVCQTNYSESDSSTCIPLIGGSCTVNNDCVTKNSYCFLKKCRCLDNFFAHSNDECTPNYIALNGTKCAQPLGQFCTKSKPCEIANSICINNRCQCIPNFMKHLNAECVPRQSYQYCEDNSDCVGTGQTCSSDNKCVCEENHIPLSNGKCAPLLDGYCSRNKDCYVKNSVCLSNRCQCNFDYLPHFNYQCEPIMIGKLCATDLDCMHIKNSRCSEDNFCVCKMNYFALDKFLCVPTLKGFCSDAQDCYSDSFYCSDNQCQCKSNHTAVSVDKCVEIILGDSCQNDEDCRNVNHAICSKNKICDCLSNNIRVNKTYCAPALMAFCREGEKCATDHASCIDNECQCDENSVQHSNDQCLPSDRKFGSLGLLVIGNSGNRDLGFWDMSYQLLLQLEPVQ